jgi:hypothetical protein
MRFYLPSWNGDFRLEGGDKGSVLKLVKPTPGERLVIGEYLRIAEGKGWVGKGTAPAGKRSPYEGKDSVELQAPLAKAAKPLIKLMRPVDRTLTAIMFSDGKLSIVEGATSGALAKIETQTAAAVAVETEDRERKEIDAKLAELNKAESEARKEADRLEKERKLATEREARAVAVRRPTPSCPNCLPGAVEPASEVLLDFLTAEQHEDWSRKRAIVVEGELTGHRYLLAHRQTRMAARMGRMCMDLDDGGAIMHFHDWGVPPEEEVLAAKLILEHREPWLRNEATCLGGGHHSVFKNPFGDGGDGTESAGIAAGFGRALLAQMTPEQRRKALAKNRVFGGKTYAELGLDAPEAVMGVPGLTMTELEMMAKGAPMTPIAFYSGTVSVGEPIAKYVSAGGDVWLADGGGDEIV